MESIIKQPYLQSEEEALIDYAIEYNAIKIFKYLVMNNAQLKAFLIQLNCCRNYEIIHLVEKENEKKIHSIIVV